MPGVKGISQRAVLLGAVADGESEIAGFGRSADTEAAIDVVRGVGVEVEDEGGETRARARRRACAACRSRTDRSTVATRAR